MKYILLALILIITPFSYTFAQVDLSLGNSEAFIEMKPTHPDPYTTFTASLNDYSLPIQVSSITWRVDGKVLTEAADQRTISLSAKGVGETTTIEAVLKLVTGESKVIKKTFTPLYLDIVVEPQTKTPAFYRGRALPSVGSTVNLTAIINGSPIPQSGLLYTWRINNQAVNGGSSIGNNRAAATIPLGQLVLVTVDVMSLDGSFSFKKSIEIPSVEPKLYFYELSPLYGLSNKAISSFNLVGDSVTVRGEPYNLDINTYNNPGHLEWKIDGSISQNPTTNPYEITLARLSEYNTGSSRASLHVRNLTQLLQGTEGEFQINF